MAEFTLKTMCYFGILRPKSITSFRTIGLYNLYSIIMLLNNFWFAISFLINLLQNRDKPDILMEGIFLFTSTILIAFKMAYLKIHQQDVKSFINLVLRKKCLPRNSEETLIYKKFQYKERLVMLFTSM